eukprot:5094812-Pyramimonas_sp.AAC.5
MSPTGFISANQCRPFFIDTRRQLHPQSQQSTISLHDSPLGESKSITHQQRPSAYASCQNRRDLTPLQGRKSHIKYSSISRGGGRASRARGTRSQSNSHL